MSVSATLENIIGGSVLDGITKVISMFKVAPDVALEHQAELAKIAADSQAKIIDAANQEIASASANIQADANSGDKFTQRARPSFMYIVEVILICNYIIFPLFHREALNLPEPLFWLFGSAILGYTGARSWEKYQGTLTGGK